MSDFKNPRFSESDDVNSPQTPEFENSFAASMPTYEQVCAFADGQLQEQDQVAFDRILQILADGSEQSRDQVRVLAGQIRHQQQLKSSCRRTGLELEAAACPERLRQAILAIPMTQALSQTHDQSRSAADFAGDQKPVALALGESTLDAANDDRGFSGSQQSQSQSREQSDENTNQNQVFETSQTPVSDRPVSDRPVLARIGVWGPLAASAVMLISTIVLVNANPSHPSLGGASAGFQPVSILSESRVRSMSDRHVACAMDITRLKQAASVVGGESGSGGALAQVAELAPDLIGVGVPDALDLTAAGYRFEAVGPCSIPGGRAIHLVYRAIDVPDSELETRPDARLSLWIRPVDGEGSIPTPDLVPNRVYTIDQDHCTPIHVWRQGGLVYYLIGTRTEACEKAVSLVRGQAA